MQTLEPFKIKIPQPGFITDIKDKVVDVGGNVSGKVVDVGGNIGGKVVDIGGKVVDIGGKVVDIGGNIGSKVKDIGGNIGNAVAGVAKGVGNVLGKGFKKLFEILMGILKNWKIALAVIVGLFILFWVSKLAGIARMFTGRNR